MLPHSPIGKVLKREQIKEIQPGKTSKKEVLKLFGAPMAILEKDESDIFFELFSQKHTITKAHRIYYYYHSLGWMIWYFFPLSVYESSRTEIDRLWILINEQTGILEDYVFREHR